MLPITRTLKIWKTAAQAVIDFLSINVAIVVLYLTRYKYFKEFFEVNLQRLNSSQYLQFSLGFSIMVMISLALIGVYEVNRKKSFLKQFTDITFGLFLVVFAIISYLFFNEFNREIFPIGISLSRFVLAAAGFVTLFFIIIGRGIFWLIDKVLYSYNIGKINVVVICDKAGDLTEYLRKQYNVEHIYEYENLTLDSLNQIQEKMQSNSVDEIYTFDNDTQSNFLQGKLAWLAQRYKVNFVFAPEGFGRYEFFDLQPRRINDKLFLEILHSNITGWRIVFKRLFDILFASIFLISFSWLYAIVALFIKLEDKGPVFYKSERIGPDGKVFQLWKFRRLKQEFCTTSKTIDNLKYEQDLIDQLDIRNDGILYKIKDDPRSTNIGKFLEKTSLDEIPQFINVLIGNMSVVGPRPHQPREVAKYQNDHYKVLNIKPGITGLAQVNGRSDIKFEQEVDLDCQYLENWSFWLDVKIIVMTPFVLLFKRHKG
jgi:exopolysaccharide biosynthesis polyprenyl glycosylphosphotransferase